MNIKSTLSDDNKILIIEIKGKFDFSLLNTFRDSYNKYSEIPNTAIVDMRQTSSIDSSALGMLLNMQRYLCKEDRDIKIINCNEEVNKVFEITCFDKKFTIEKI